MEQVTIKTNYLIEPKKEMLDDLEITYEKDSIISKEELYNSIHLNTADLDQHMVDVIVPIKTETILTKEEVLDDLDVTYDIGKDSVITKKELYNSIHLNTADLDQHVVDVIVPIKTETILTKEEVLDDLDVTYDIGKDSVISKKELYNSIHLNTADLDQKTIYLMGPIKTETILSKEIVELQNSVGSLEDVKPTVCNTDMVTGYLKTSIKREPSQAEATLDNSQPIINIGAVPSSTKHTPQDGGKKSILLNHHTELKQLLQHNNTTTVKRINFTKHSQTQHTSTEPHLPKHNNIECANKYTIVKHIRIQGRKYHTCNYCDYKNRTKCNLKAHMSAHTGERPYYCDLCDFKSSTKGTLRTHIMTHTSEKSYACKYCELKFLRLSNLKTHIKTHTGEKPYFCEHCNNRFSRIDTLKRHMNTHTGKKAHACDQCDYKCSRLSTLKEHVRIHTGEKPYSCVYCDHKCASFNALKYHKKTHTREKP